MIRRLLCWLGFHHWPNLNGLDRKCLCCPREELWCYRVASKPSMGGYWVRIDEDTKAIQAIDEMLRDCREQEGNEP